MSVRGLSREALAIAATLVVGAVIFSAAAFYNGFPLVFPDSGGYAATYAPTFRSPFYGILILFFHLRINLWPIVLVQGLMVAHVLYVTVRVVFGEVDTGRFLVLAVLLTGLTSLPWFSGQIMPDIFAPVMVLIMVILACCRDQLSQLEIAYFFLLATGSVAVHTTHLPLVLGLVLVLLAASFLLGKKGNFRLGGLALLVGPAVIAALALTSTNFVVHRVASISPGGPGFLLARSYADGPAYRYLRDVCPTAGYELCVHLDNLPTDSEEFLWSADSPFKQANGFETLQDEASRIVREATKAYPGLQLAVAGRHLLQQLVTFRTAAEIISYTDKTSPSRIIEELFPGSYDAYVDSRQGQNKIPTLLLGRIGNVVVMVSVLVGIVLCIGFWRRGRFLPVVLFSCILLALLGNAILTGALSGVFDRYQSRLVWLLAFFAAAGLLWRNQETKDQ